MSDPLKVSKTVSTESKTVSMLAKRQQPYLQNLNSEQLSAVEETEGPLLVLAGAGTGKTRVLTTRLSHIIHTNRARPSEVLAVTFTNKAARQMVERVAELLGRPADGLWLGTFHSIAARILRQNAELVGLRSDFTILDTDDQTRLLKQLLKSRNIDDKRWPARTLCTMIQRWKDQGLSSNNIERIEILDKGEFANGEAPSIFLDYQKRLEILNAADFGDLLAHCITIFKSNPDLLSSYQKRFKYILVDEYQDTNVAQYLWLRLLAATEDQNICCVGDDDQSIYGWRGAEVGNILRFEKDFSGAKVIRLERNYRSSGNILEAASGLIGKNSGRLGKTLWTKGDQGLPISITGTWDGEEEARLIGNEIEILQEEGQCLEEIAILVRASFQTRAFEERFLSIGIPYRVIGGPRFYERQEIRDAIAYIRMLVQPDDDLAFERIINVPKRGLGDASLQIIHQISRAKNISLNASAQLLVQTDDLSKKARNSLAKLLEDFNRWRSLIKSHTHWELLKIILDESGYTDMWLHDKSPQSPGRLENLKELVSAIEEFEGFSTFLEHISLVMDNEEGRTSQNNAIIVANDANIPTKMLSIMTLHSAKGLEFNNVFLPGWEEGLFPHQLALDENGSTGLEEERRLAYVGLTRARKQVQIFFSANRRIYNQWVSSIPSRFIDEIPSDNVIAKPVNQTTHLDNVNKAHLNVDEKWISPAGYLGTKLRPRKELNSNDVRAEWEEEPAKTRHSGSKFNSGDRVIHRKFGLGVVKHADGDKLEILFDKVGRKKVIDRFIESE
tara:strand:- start:5954 stop:8311 length:2358 start_codon:yes stop_codon:yes gene_type:complete